MYFVVFVCSQIGRQVFLSPNWFDILERVIFLSKSVQFHRKHNVNYIKVHIFAAENLIICVMDKIGFKFVELNVKYGCSVDGKKFCAVSDAGITIYDNVDDFFNDWRAWIEKYVMKK